MKGYATSPKAPRVESHHQIILCHVQDTRWGHLTLLQRCSRCILYPKPTVLDFFVDVSVQSI